MWLEDKNEVEQMEEDKRRFVDDYIIDVALEELEWNLLRETREVVAAMPVGKLARAEMKTTAEAPKNKAKEAKPKTRSIH